MSADDLGSLRRLANACNYSGMQSSLASNAQAIRIDHEDKIRKLLATFDTNQRANFISVLEQSMLDADLVLVFSMVLHDKVGLSDRLKKLLDNETNPGQFFESVAPFLERLEEEEIFQINSLIIESLVHLGLDELHFFMFPNGLLIPKRNLRHHDFQGEIVIFEADKNGFLNNVRLENTKAHFNSKQMKQIQRVVYEVADRLPEASKVRRVRPLSFSDELPVLEHATRPVDGKKIIMENWAQDLQSKVSALARISDTEGLMATVKQWIERYLDGESSFQELLGFWQQSIENLGGDEAIDLINDLYLSEIDSQLKLAIRPEKKPEDDFRILYPFGQSYEFSFLIDEHGMIVAEGPDTAFMPQQHGLYRVRLWISRSNDGQWSFATEQFNGDPISLISRNRYMKSLREMVEALQKWENERSD